MPTYSMDLRTRVMDALSSGMKKSVICKTFNVCYQTLYNWINRKKETGNVKPITNFQNGHSHGIKDLEAFKKFVDENPDLTQEEIGKHFNVGSSTISRNLLKIGYTRKKRVKRMRKETRKKEQIISTPLNS